MTGAPLGRCPFFSLPAHPRRRRLQPFRLCGNSAPHPCARETDMPRLTAPLILGWEEWVELPELGLPAIKAKVDTGARTSALHAIYVEPFGPARARKVRFGVHPVPNRNDIEIDCKARLIGERVVRSSNGEREKRYVIETPIRIAGREWPIEVTLADRNMMSYRMLLGRQAIAADVLVSPSSSFLQPKLGYKSYKPGRG